jgi:hypothetical protein
MSTIQNLRDGYYWARHDDGTTFVVFLENGLWYVPGISHAINQDFREHQIIAPVKHVDQ